MSTRPTGNTRLISRGIYFSVLICGFVAVFFTSCDPAYHLSYAVLNDTGKPVYCKDASKQGLAAVQKIEVDSGIIVYEEAGFGHAKSQFKESKQEVTTRFTFYSDSTCSSDSQIIPVKGWKYYRLPIGGDNARMYIREKDLAKK
jgi:hypothetical protein